MPAAAETVLIDRDAIARRVRELGDAITGDLAPAFGPRPPGAVAAGADSLVLIPVLTGALVFTADLVRQIPLRLSIRPVTLSSYRGDATSPGALLQRDDVPANLAGRHVLIVDDILDTGQTLAWLRDAVAAQRPASLRICVLLRKSKPRLRAVEAQYVGFDIPDEFVVGYGLDFDGYERNRPDVVVLPEAGRRP